MKDGLKSLNQRRVMRDCLWSYHKEAFKNYVYKCDFFWPPTPLRWHFLPNKRWQKVDIFGQPNPLLL